MFKKIIFIGAVMLLSSCSNSDAAKAPDNIQVIQDSGRGTYPFILVIKDTTRGCEYVRSSYDSPFVYLHGSCTDIIKQEGAYYNENIPSS